MYMAFAVQIPSEKGKISRQHTKSGTYIHYILERSYNAKKQQTAPKRILIGKAIENTDTMFPNEKFFDIYPDAVLPEIRDKAYRCSMLMAGSFIVIEHVARGYDLINLLQKHFHDQTGLILDLASYMIIEQRNQGQYFPNYAYRHPLFSKDMHIASDSMVSELFADITQDQIFGFLDDWNEKRDHQSRIYISYDSTNKNTQAGDIEFAEFGKPKVDIGCEIFNVGVAFDKTNKEPLFYEFYPGSIPDVSELKFLVDKAIAYHYKNVGFILDRGYFSKANIAYMDKNKYEFVMMVKGCKPLVSGLIDQLQNTFEKKDACALITHHINGTTLKRKLFPEDSKERYFHVYFSPMKYTTERMALDNTLIQMQKMFDRCIGKVVKFESPYTDYFDCLYNIKNGEFLCANRKRDVIDKENARCGYFCIVTSEKMNAEEAYLLYTGRDVSEKTFAADKSFIGSKSMRVYSQSSISAKIFIEFIALIIRQRIFNLLKDQMMKLPVKKNYLTVPAAIKELEKFEISRCNGQYQIDHAITRTQEVIFNSFGLKKDMVEKRATEISTTIKKLDKAINENKIS